MLHLLDSAGVLSNGGSFLRSIISSDSCVPYEFALVTRTSLTTTFPVFLTLKRFVRILDFGNKYVLSIVITIGFVAGQAEIEAVQYQQRLDDFNRKDLTSCPHAVASVLSTSAKWT